MLSYELAKVLKDAGWPQPDIDMVEYQTGDWIGDPTAGSLSFYEKKSRAIYSPSLDELIEACPLKIGYHTFDLRYVDEKSIGITMWVAQYVCNADVRESIGGKTALEAVANLWVALKNGGHL